MPNTPHPPTPALSTTQPYPLALSPSHAALALSPSPLLSPSLPHPSPTLARPAAAAAQIQITLPAARSRSARRRRTAMAVTTPAISSPSRICFPPLVATTCTLPRQTPFRARAVSMLLGWAWRHSTSTRRGKAGREWWLIRTSCSPAGRTEATPAALASLTFVFVAAKAVLVEPSAYEQLAVAAEEAPWPAAMEGALCCCPPMVVMALPYHLGSPAFRGMHGSTSSVPAGLRSRGGGLGGKALGGGGRGGHRGVTSPAGQHVWLCMVQLNESKSVIK